MSQTRRFGLKYHFGLAVRTNVRNSATVDADGSGEAVTHFWMEVWNKGDHDVDSVNVRDSSGMPKCECIAGEPVSVRWRRYKARFLINGRNEMALGRMSYGKKERDSLRKYTQKLPEEDKKKYPRRDVERIALLGNNISSHHSVATIK